MTTAELARKINAAVGRNVTSGSDLYTQIRQGHIKATATETSPYASRSSWDVSEVEAEWVIQVYVEFYEKRAKHGN